jgi:hypothetical protein
MPSSTWRATIGEGSEGRRHSLARRDAARASFARLLCVLTANVMVKVPGFAQNLFLRSQTKHSTACILARTARAEPADLAPRPRTAPRAPPAVGQRRCMLLLLPPPRDSYASGDGLRGPVKNAMGPPHRWGPFYRNQAFGPPQGLCPSHSALHANPTAACATP